jgi:hypothetical protein
MNFILALKHWQVFLFIMVGLYLINFNNEYFLLSKTFLIILGTIIYSLWPLLTVISLSKLQSQKKKIHTFWFFLTTFIWIGVYVAIPLFYTEKQPNPDFLILPRGCAIISYLYFISYPAKILKSIEIGRKQKLEDYVADLFLVIFLPIGIWFLQPRINRILLNEQLPTAEKLNNNI